MTEGERAILKAVVHRGGQLSPADLINGIARRDRRSVDNLVVSGYIEEVPQEIHRMRGNNYTVVFYRATEKGQRIFAPIYQRIWFGIREDFRTIMVSAITAIITTLIAIALERLL